MKAFSPGLYSTDPDHYHNRIISSRLNFYERVDRDSQHLSIKYVRQGSENYRVGNHTHSVSPKTFLVVNKGQVIETSLNDSKPVLGVCFFLDNHFLDDVHRNLSSTDEALLNNPFDGSKTQFEVCEDVFDIHENSLGTLVSSIADEVYAKGLDFQPDPTLYYALAVQVFELQKIIRTQAVTLGKLKTSTRHELFRRIRIAARYIESNYQNPIDVAAIAKECSLSEFHFLRSFSKIYGITPYQFVLSKRLANAAELLKSKHSVTNIAAICGFADVAALSKAFRKKYHISPSKFLGSEML